MGHRRISTVYKKVFDKDDSTEKDLKKETVKKDKLYIMYNMCAMLLHFG